MSEPLSQVAVGLAAALGVGWLIGLEQGWRTRDQPDGSRVAGLRTFSLIGLFGGVLASLPQAAWALPAGLLAIGVVMAVGYRESTRQGPSLSATTAVTGLLTSALGALAASGHAVVALSAAVVVALLLDYKATLHGWLRLVELREWRAALQFLVLSVVVLPWLPDTGMGPNASLNPYRLWWAVVLLAGMSFGSHVVMRLSGPERGMLWTGVLGGVTSSTTVTLTLARRAALDRASVPVAAAGALAAGGVMFVRIGLIVAVMQPSLLRLLALPLAGGAVVMFALCGWHWHQREQAAPAVAGAQADATVAVDEAAIKPFDLGTVLSFGALLAVVTVMVDACKAWFGDSGLYGAVAASGLVDVDAIVVSLARRVADESLVASVAARGIALACLTNVLTKVGLAYGWGGHAFGRRVTLGWVAATLVGAGLLLAAGA
ncbi:DUF4010 domain-containing protein [Ideonella sp. DXS29W]|uniref:DUF4010 domain-containing protein n=1 Tax=Ideonella lacteola TaxID=2984193 RepID=A0ABU9BJ95_9BURK